MAYDRLYGLGYTKPILEFLRFGLFRLLAAQGCDVEWDELDTRPKPQDPDTTFIDRVM